MIVAALMQFVGALLPTLIFQTFVWNGYITHNQTGEWGEGLRAVYWVAGPLAIALAIPLFFGSNAARLCSMVLCIAYPLGPVLDIYTLKEKLHGGEIFVLAFSVLGLIGGGMLLAILWFTGVTIRKEESARSA